MILLYDDTNCYRMLDDTPIYRMILLGLDDTVIG
jgi:hypothetical protein